MDVINMLISYILNKWRGNAKKEEKNIRCIDIDNISLYVDEWLSSKETLLGIIDEVVQSSFGIEMIAYQGHIMGNENPSEYEALTEEEIRAVLEKIKRWAS